MNGARALIATLVGSGVEVCFANPGTSEMQFVAALDDVPEMRAVLGLFEGVVTGAADGYGRVAQKPAATLLHLGPGLGNGVANLHNARRAHTPIVNIVGDHATYHQRFDAPLQSDIESLARPVSSWFRSSHDPHAVAGDAAQAVRAAFGPPGGVATLVVPADVSWLEAGDPAPPLRPAARRRVDDGEVDAIAKVLRGGAPTALMIGGSATRRRGLVAASRVASATGSKLLCETFPALLERGAGLPSVERLAYLAELAALQLDGLRHLVLVDAQAPVSFFAYPGKASDLVPDGCDVHVLAGGGDDAESTLEALAEVVGALPDGADLQPASRPTIPNGTLNAQTAAAVIGALLPEGAIVSDEANTAGIFIPAATAGAPPHQWLCLTGGAIGQGLPVATGAAVAAPGHKVLSLEADGSAMYTLQALWTQAREGLDVTTVIYNNSSYGVLEMEFGRIGASSPGPRALDMLDLTRPDLDFASLARGMGVMASRALTTAEFADQLGRALDEPGPALVEAMVGRGLG